MRDIRVYVSGISGIVGLGIVKNLRMAYPEIEIYGTALDEFCVGARIVDHFFVCPRSDADSYLTWLSNFLRENNINYSIPGIDIDLHIWNTNRELFSQIGGIPIINKSNLITIARDKYRFFLEVDKYKFSHTIPTLIQGNYEELCDFFGTNRLIAKPKIGFAKKGFLEIDSEFDFAKVVGDNLGNVIFQPNLSSDGYEYTSSVFGDGEGDFSSIISLKRKLAPEGYSNYVTRHSSAVLSDIIRKYCEIFQPIGPTNFQFMSKAEEFFLLEINPRFSSSTSMRGLLGYNESKMAIDYYEDGILPQQPIIKSGSVIRFIEDFYIDE